MDLVATFWDNYAYLSLRMPLLPNCSMIHPFHLQSANIPETHETAYKVTARIVYHIIEFWKFLREERIKSGSTSKTPLTSWLHRRLYNTCRLPGEQMDSIWSAFKTEKEGPCPTHVMVFAKRRYFKIEAVDENGNIQSPQYYLAMFEAIKDIVNNDKRIGDGVAVLTCDDRTNWAINRKRLQEVSERNRETLQTIESAITVVVLDEQCPTDYSETLVDIMAGNLVERWADKSLNHISFANGKVGCVGEHTCYDGTVAVHLSDYLLVSLSSGSEPDWSVKVGSEPPAEIVFDLNDQLRNEITRMKVFANKQKLSISTEYSYFMDFGKEMIKTFKIHPDTFIQLAIQLTHYRLHGEHVATYETALMRNYSKGRTETVRSCTEDAVKWVKCMTETEEVPSTKAKLLRVAAKRQTELMNDARSGRGIDRHLFALWCIAYENGVEIPKFYDDPLYSCSGGGGNFVLSTSTLGFSVSGGCVAPMCLDGYGCFYNILPNSIIFIVTTYNDSNKTNCKKFTQYLHDSLRMIRELLDWDSSSKL
ncbi:Choline/carnitine acyltransferase domain [Sergentomyia squamirostris]